jgi:hypothetical protein
MRHVERAAGSILVYPPGPVLAIESWVQSKPKAGVIGPARPHGQTQSHRVQRPRIVLRQLQKERDRRPGADRIDVGVVSSHCRSQDRRRLINPAHWPQGIRPPRRIWPTWSSGSGPADPRQTPARLRATTGRNRAKFRGPRSKPPVRHRPKSKSGRLDSFKEPRDADRVAGRKVLVAPPRGLEPRSLG